MERVEAIIPGVLPSIAARRLNLSPSRIRELCTDGELAFVVTPYGRLICEDSLVQLEAKRATQRSVKLR